MPALETYDSRRTIGEQIDDLPLALVTPLSADYDYVFTHGLPACWLVPLAAHKKQCNYPDDHDYETQITDVIVTQARYFRHHLAVLSWRDERQHALDNEHEGDCREYFRGYCSPSD